MATKQIKDVKFTQWPFTKGLLLHVRMHAIFASSPLLIHMGGISLCGTTCASGFYNLFGGGTSWCPLYEGLGDVLVEDDVTHDLQTELSCLIFTH